MWLENWKIQIKIISSSIEYTTRKVPISIGVKCTYTKLCSDAMKEKNHLQTLNENFGFSRLCVESAVEC